jgi:hypothetical protein
MEKREDSYLYGLQLHLNFTKQNANNAWKCNIFGRFEFKRRLVMPSGQPYNGLTLYSKTTELCTEPSERW